MEYDIDIDKYNYVDKFEINGIDADVYDFGERKNEALNPPRKGWWSEYFEPKEATKKVLETYKITQAEYTELCEFLVANLRMIDHEICAE